tara:strand:+ start:3967 stop:5679 length:1713 start_codon:yes stop_codon:yes gene_type:complete
MSRNKIALVIFIVSLVVASAVNLVGTAVWKEQRFVYPLKESTTGDWMYEESGEYRPIGHWEFYSQSPLRQQALDESEPKISKQWVKLDNNQLVLLKASFHFGFWSLLPAILAIALCLLTKEPITALLGGIFVAAFMLGRYDITDDVLLPSMASPSVAFILLLYLWLLGGLLGVWSRTGAAQAFADYMTQHFVRGPRTAKLVAWMLGVLFFQGGSISTVLVGVTVKPLADKANISHEEMSYIVDSTASPIASILAFNAWPAYVQSLIFVPGVAFLATESQRIGFFFSSIPFSFYSILAVLGTFLLSVNVTWHCGGRIRAARLRALNTGQLDAEGSNPLSSAELHRSMVPDHYVPQVFEFLVPLISLIAIAVGTFILFGTPKVNWAFGAALLMSCSFALIKGMSLQHLLEGIGNGMKGVVMASVLLVLAITIGSLNQDVGGGLFLIDLLGERVPYWILPVILQLLTMIIAFSTGTSWGTYAIAFPLAMPLAWSIGLAEQVANPEVFMAICFAAVLNGSVYGDQCSPISDTTILSAMTTGCDLMDHVKSQIVPASLAASMAGLLWTLSAFLLV